MVAQQYLLCLPNESNSSSKDGSRTTKPMEAEDLQFCCSHTLMRALGRVRKRSTTGQTIFARFLKWPLIYVEVFRDGFGNGVVGSRFTTALPVPEKLLPSDFESAGAPGNEKKIFVTYDR